MPILKANFLEILIRLNHPYNVPDAIIRCFAKFLNIQFVALHISSHVIMVQTFPAALNDRFLKI